MGDPGKADRGGVVRIPHYLKSEVLQALSGTPTRSESIGSAIDFQIDQALGPEPPHPDDKDPHVAALLAHLAELKTEARRLLETDGTRRDVLAKANTIRTDREKLDRMRRAAREARKTGETHELDEKLPGFLGRGIQLLEQLAEWTAGVDALVALGWDRGAAAEARFPFPLLLPEHADRLKRALAPIAHHNGLVGVKIIALADRDHLDAKGLRRLRAAAAEFLPDGEWPDRNRVKDRGLLDAFSGRWPNRGELRFFTAEAARVLVDLKLAEGVKEED